jgi:hypothetical protein
VLTEEEKLQKAQEFVALLAKKADFHPDLVVEADETALQLTSQDQYTYDEQNKERVVIDHAEEKRSFTATVSVTSSGTLLPLQIVWKGLTSRSIPSGHWPPGTLNCVAGQTGEITTTNSRGEMKVQKKSNQWQNVTTTLRLVNEVYAPYFQKARQSPKLLATVEQFKNGSRAAVLWDGFYTHHDERVVKALADLNCDVLYVPSAATDLFQLCDVAFNKPFKDYMKDAFGCVACFQYAH